jgi:hypothetical protein
LSAQSSFSKCRGFNVIVLATRLLLYRAGSDRTINPDLERWYAKWAGSHTVEVAGASHCVYVSHPKQVADVIESAARAVSK